MRIVAAILCIFFGSSLLKADSDIASTLATMVETFAHLDSEWRLVSASEASPSDLKRYEVELQKSAETFVKIAAEYQKVNPKLSEITGVLEDLIVTSAHVLFTGMEKQQPGKQILTAHKELIDMLPGLFLGVVLALNPSGQQPDALLGQDDIKSLRSLIAKKFGQTIAGEKSINGDNAFARTASLLDGFLNTLEK